LSVHTWFEDHHNSHQARRTGSPASEAVAGWWRRGAQQKSRGLARRGSRPERLRLGRRRRPSAAQADGASVQAGRRHGSSAALLPQAASLQAGRRRGVRRRGDPGSPTGGLQRSFSSQLLLLPLSPSLLAVVRGKSPMGRQRIWGEPDGGGFIGRCPRA
jgi:hypothetical protein